MRRTESRPEAAELAERLEKRQRPENPQTIIASQQQTIDHLLKVVSQQGATIRKLQKLLSQLPQEPPKLKIESIQALYTILQEAIKRHTGITFILGRIALPTEPVRTRQVHALLQEVQALRLAYHTTTETSKFLTRFIPKLARLIEQYPSAETPIPIGLIDRVFTIY